MQSIERNNRIEKTLTLSKKKEVERRLRESQRKWDSERQTTSFIHRNIVSAQSSFLNSDENTLQSRRNSIGKKIDKFEFK